MEINQLELAEVARASAVIRLQLLVAILGESQVSTSRVSSRVAELGKQKWNFNAKYNHSI